MATKDLKAAKDAKATKSTKTAKATDGARATQATKAAPAATTDAKPLTVTLRKSTIGFNRNQARVVEGMGLRRIGHSVTLPDNPATRGMILKVRHLVEVE